MNFNHIALAVPDLEAAAHFYEQAFQMKRIRTDNTHDRCTHPDGVIFKIYGAKLQKVHVAYLSCGNGVGFELFQFVDPEVVPKEEVPQGTTFNYQRSGFYHACITVGDVPGMVQRVVELGGEKHGEIVDVGTKGAQAAYVTDPWGNVVELLSSSFESLLANTG